MSAVHGGAAVAADLAAEQIVRLDAGGSLVNGGDAHVAHVLRRSGLLDETHAAVYLHADGGDLVGCLGAPRLDDRNQQIAAGLGSGARRGVRMEGREVELLAGIEGKRSRCFRAGLHGQQHAPHVRVMDDGQPLGVPPRRPGLPCMRVRAYSAACWKARSPTA